MLRTPAKFVYRLLRPLVRPIAFRVRGFLLVDVQRELSELRREAHALHGQARQEMRLLSGETQELVHRILLAQREMQDQGHALREVLESLARASGIERSELSAEIIQEVQASRSFLETDIFNLSARIVGELRTPASARTVADGPHLEGERPHPATPPVVIDCAAGEVIVGTQAGYLFCRAGERQSIPSPATVVDAQRGTLRLIQRLVRPGGLFIDISPGMGLGTLTAARAMQASGRVLAYESRGEIAHLLEKSVLLNGLSDLIEIQQAVPFSLEGAGDDRRVGASDDRRLPPPSMVRVPGRIDASEWLAGISEKIGGGYPVAAVRLGSDEALPVVLGVIQAVARYGPDVPVIGEFEASRIREAGWEWSALLAAFAEHGIDFRMINAETGALELSTDDRTGSMDSIRMLLARTGSPFLKI
ncbi:hypothetical protein ATSB10_35910 [Dyella thiooxydans]|uniref:Methyltransferase n=1 Tax=Dyella thiooxydans TaxID=445710 RepID=A0A161J382_9GAMM|nr:hypothetical protein ATSB10_35910 [Dyella thiooxydans]